MVVFRIIQGDGVLLSTKAGGADFPRRRTGSRSQARSVSRRHARVEKRVASFYFAATRRQNWVSLSSVILWPFSRRRLMSISLRPPSRPAACNGFGRPRTTTVVWADGPL